MRVVSLLVVLVFAVGFASASPIARLHGTSRQQVNDAPVPYTNCGSSADLMTITAVSANAWPPVKGADLTINAVGTLSQAVTGGTYEIKATFLGIPVLDQKGSLSDLVTLPLAAGSITISKTENLPSAIPSGTINIQITANDDQGHEIVCLKVVVTLTATPSIVLTPIPNVAVPYTHCDGASAKMPITAITASSWPPVMGSSVDLTTVYDAKEVVTGGESNAKVEYFGIVLSDKTNTLENAGFALPIQVGPYSLLQKLEVPTGLPSGELVNTVSAKDTAGLELFCVKISFTV